jgi:hypothetical protein
MISLIPKDGSIFDIQKLFFLLTIDSATHFLFGESVGAMEGDNVLSSSSVGGSQGFAESFNIAQEYLAWRSMALDFYWMINPKEFREATRRVHEVVDHYVYRAIEAKKNAEKNGIEGGRYVFAEALAADNDNPKVLRDNMLNILLAGRDTTASLLSSTFWFLARHQDVWEKLHRVIIEEFGDAEHPKGEITHARLKEVRYLRYVLNEGTLHLPSLTPSLFFCLIILLTIPTIQSSASCPPSPSTSASQQKTPPSRSAAAPRANPRSTSPRGNRSCTACTPCTAARTSTGPTQNLSVPSAGRRMPSAAGNTCRLMVGRGFVWGVCVSLQSCPCFVNE